MNIPKARKLTSGNWFIWLRLGGQQRPITAPTETECKNTALRIKTDYITQHKRPAVKADLTLRQVCDDYIEQYRPVLSPSTIRGYVICARNRFAAYQNMPLGNIPWQRMINDEIRNYSEKTVKNAWGLVHAALKLAGYPVPQVKLATAPVKEIAFLQPDEILAFCDAVAGRSYEIPALLALNGLRVSEIRGLQWEHIDFKRNVIRVRGALIPSDTGEVRRQANKTSTSTRDVPILIPQLKDALRAARQPTGAIVNIAAVNVLRDVKRACNRAGVTEVTTHGLRHSFASLGYYLKIPERQLMLWGGWKDYQVMHKIYIRVAAVAEQQSRTTVEAFFDKTITV